MNKNITSYIMARLFRYSVCQKTGLAWKDAQALVEQVKQEHSEEIEARQIPLKSVLAFTFYILGILLTVGPIIYLWVMLDVTSTFLVFVSSPSTVKAEAAIKLFGSRCALLGWFQLPSLGFTVLVGLGIINANLRYMRGVWASLFRQWNVID